MNVVYIIKYTNIDSNKEKYTYVGASVNLEKRLRQHNGEISGGAVYTTSKIKNNGKWSLVGYVYGFPDWKHTLQFEWRLKQLSRKENGTPVQKRMKGLHKLMHLNKSTEKSTPFNTWLTPPQVIFEDTNAELYYNSLFVPSSSICINSSNETAFANDSTK